MYRPMLRFGSSGEPVLLLQKALNLASKPVPLLVTDGIFGTKTRACVCQFQRSRNLAQDGIVGPKTHSDLEDAYAALARLVDDYLIPPEDEAAARQRIVDIAKSQLSAFGWIAGVQPPDPFSPRIAIRYMTDAATRARQGGPQLSIIYALAGRPATKCLTIPQTPAGLAKNDENPLSEAQYKQLRNAKDLENWCGIFALSVWRSAGLTKMPMWDSKPFLPFSGYVTAIGPKDVKPGDVGIVEPMGGRNHHFIVIDVQEDMLTSVDGNAGQYHSILGRKYQLSDPNSSSQGPHIVKAIPGVFGQEKAYFATPIWSKVL